MLGGGGDITVSWLPETPSLHELIKPLVRLVLDLLYS
jgi:hypothetical protein